MEDVHGTRHLRTTLTYMHVILKVIYGFVLKDASMGYVFALGGWEACVSHACVV